MIAVFGANKRFADITGLPREEKSHGGGGGGTRFENPAYPCLVFKLDKFCSRDIARKSEEERWSLPDKVPFFEIRECACKRA